MIEHGTLNYSCDCLACRGARTAHDTERRPSKQERLERVAAAMREFYLSHGKGCKTRKRVISRRTTDNAPSGL